MRTNDEIMDILEQRKDEMGLSTNEIARQLGMAKSSISRYFNRTREFPLNKLDVIAKLLHLDTKYILGFEGEEIKDFESSGNVNLDYLGSVAAGGFEQGYSRLENISVPSNILKEEKDNYFVLKANGDSMNKVIANDHYIVVLDFRKSDNTFFKTNDIVIVRNGSEYTMKRVRKTERRVHFEPDSYIDEFETQSFKINDFNELMIIGKVVYSFKEYN